MQLTATANVGALRAIGCLVALTFLASCGSSPSDEPSATAIASEPVAASPAPVAQPSPSPAPAPSPVPSTPSVAPSTPTEPAPASADGTLETGDCFDLWYAGGRETTEAECDGPHDAEMIDVFKLKRSEDMSDTETRSKYTVRCGEAALPVIERQPDPASLTLLVIDPDLMSSSGDGRSVGCSVARIDQSPLPSPLE